MFPDEDGLYRYMLGRNGNVRDAQLVVLEGEPSGDEDFDADEGTVLITPTAIVRDPRPGQPRTQAPGASAGEEGQEGRKKAGGGTRSRPAHQHADLR